MSFIKLTELCILYLETFGIISLLGCVGSTESILLNKGFYFGALLDCGIVKVSFLLCLVGQCCLRLGTTKVCKCHLVVIGINQIEVHSRSGDFGFLIFNSLTPTPLSFGWCI